jgi:hypothetical protein
METMGSVARNCATATWPKRQATASGLWPVMYSARSASAPAAWSSCTIAKLPEAEARQSAVQKLPSSSGPNSSTIV